MRPAGRYESGARPLVSVIVPTHNHADYLALAIESVLSQSYPHFEIIVVDDGSTDATGEVLQRYAERIRCVRQPNRGLSAARNHGLQLARGDLIGLLDADDLYGPEYLLTLVTLLASHPEAGGAYCGFRSIDGNGRLLAHIHSRVVSPDAMHDSLLMGNFLGVNTPLIRHSCYRQVGGFDETLRASEDWDIWLRLTRSFRLVGISEPLVFRRDLAQSMSSDPRRMLVSRLQVLAKHLGPLEQVAADPPIRLAYANAYLTSCVEHLQAGKAADAYERLVDMITACPAALGDLRTFYELGCGAQSRGCRGHFATMSLDDNARWLLETLRRLTADPRTAPRLAAYRHQARGNAHLAMGLLNYGARRLSQARHHLWQAVRANPRLLTDRRVPSTFARSLLLQVGLGPR